MKKHRGIIASVAILLISLVIGVVSVVEVESIERQVVVLESEKEDKNAQIQQLTIDLKKAKSDLSESKQRSLELADKLNQIEMRNEGIKYQEELDEE